MSVRNDDTEAGQLRLLLEDACVRNDEPGVLRLLRGATAGTKVLALTHCARTGNERLCRALLDAGASANANDSVALANAASSGHERICELLLERGAVASARTSWSLNFALEEGHWDIACLLLRHGACADDALPSGLNVLLKSATLSEMDLLTALQPHLSPAQMAAQASSFGNDTLAEHLSAQEARASGTNRLKERMR